MAARRYCPSAAPTGKEASAVQAILDRLGRAEAQLLRGRDLDRGAGRRIAAFAGCRFLDLELAEAVDRSEDHTSELQSLMRISYAVFCLKKKNTIITISIHKTFTVFYISHTQRTFTR